MTTVSVGGVAPVLLPAALKRRADILAAVLRDNERADMPAERMAQWLERPVPVFFDVFAVLERPYLLAIGPALPHLWHILGAPRVTIDGAPAEWHMDTDIRGDGCLTIRFMLIKTPAGAPKEIRFVWRDFEQTVAVRDNPWRDKTPQATLMTLQRGNRPEWIRDWCMYYHRVHGINRILIYNNKDHVERALTDCVAGIGDALEVEFVAWPFPYPYPFNDHAGGGAGVPAPRLFGMGNIHCQIGALTHAYWQLGKRAPYFLNFDIDEYLVNKTRTPLLQLLAQRISRRAPALIVKERPVVNRRDNGAGAPRVCDFRFRLKSYTGVLTEKTICGASLCRVIDVHSAALPGKTPPLTWRLLAGEEIARLPVGEGKPCLLAGAENAGAEPVTNKPRFLFSRILNSYRRRIRRKYYQLFTEAEWPDLYFNHYWGLNTGWNTIYKGHLRAETRPVTEDKRILALLKEAGICRERQT